MLAAQSTTRNSPDIQQQTIAESLCFLAQNPSILGEGCEEKLSDILKLSKLGDSLPPKEEYEAFNLCKAYRHALKKAGIKLPTILGFRYRYEVIADPHDEYQFTVNNLSKGSSYEVTRLGDADFSCTCEAGKYGNMCSHAFKVIDHLGLDSGNDLSQSLKDGESSESVLTLAPEKTQIVDSVSALDSLPGRKTSHEVEQSSGLKIEPPILQTRKMETPGISLTPGQEKAMEQLDQFLETGKSIHGLYGFSGTGKTTLLQAWIKRRRERGCCKRIVFTAPTNKAVAVLRSMVSKWGLGNIECRTCASLLGLKQQIDPKNGSIYFTKRKGAESTIANFDLIVVDECSMVSSSDSRRKGLWEHLTEEAGLFNQLLFVGDWAQLPPVNEAISKTFLEIQDPSVLTEVMRYRGAIATVADKLRSRLEKNSPPLLFTEHNEDKSEGLFSLKYDRWVKTIVKLFCSPNYQQDPNYCRVLAYKNERVSEINTIIRTAIFSNASRFEVGERLIAQKPYRVESFGSPETIFATSTELEVIDIKQGTLEHWKVYWIEAKVLDDDFERLVHFPVLHESEQKDFEEKQEALKQEAIAGNTSTWREFYRQQGLFAWIEYAYAITVHKSQGSTFQNVFVDMRDIGCNKTKNTFKWPGGSTQLVYEMNQLSYVALTRASKRAFTYE